MAARSRRRADAARGQAADDLRGWWGDPFRRRRSIGQTGACTGLSGDQYADGLGGYPATDKQSLGMLGMHGTYEANMAMQNCDVLIAVGARFDDRVIGNPSHFGSVPRKIIHIDIDPSSIRSGSRWMCPSLAIYPRFLMSCRQLEASKASRC
jgi:glyoxylate carboligase